MLHCYCVDTCELCAIAIKSQHLLVPFSNNLAVEFDLLKATQETAQRSLPYLVDMPFFSLEPLADLTQTRDLALGGSAVL